MMILRAIFIIALLSPIPAHAVDPLLPSDYYRLYAHSKVISATQYDCLNQLWTKESNWRPSARNGSHYGIPQLRNDKVGRLDAFKQIDWGLRYIRKHNEYDGDMCKAWQHFKDKGWY